MYKNFSFVNNFVSCHENWDIFKYWVPTIARGFKTNFGDMSQYFSDKDYNYVSEVVKELVSLPQVAFEIRYDTGYLENLHRHNRVELPLNHSVATRNKLACKHALETDNRLMLINHIQVLAFESGLCLQLHGRHIIITDDVNCADLKKVYHKIVRADSIDSFLSVTDYV